MTTARIDTFQDLLDLLDERPQWVGELRVRLLTADLVALPEQFARFVVETNQRLDALAGLPEQVEELKASQARTEADVRELKAGQARMEGRQARTEADVQELKEGQARLESDVRELKAGQARMEGRQARTEADVQELKEGQARLETDVQELKAGQARMEERQARTEADVQELKEGQARLETDVQELKAGQARLEERQARTEADVQELKEGQARLETGQNHIRGEINNLRGDKYERRITRFIANTARSRFNMRQVRVLLGEFTPDNNELIDLLDDAEENRGIITAEQGQDLGLADIIIAGVNRADGTPLYAVIEAAVTLNRDDVVRVKRRADVLSAVTGQAVLPAVIGSAIDEIDRRRADDAGVGVVIIRE